MFVGGIGTPGSPEYIKLHKTCTPPLAFLKDMLYMALYVPEGKAEFPKSILNTNELRKYYEAFGEIRGDMAVIASIENEYAGIVWGRFFPALTPGYGFISKDIPEITLAVEPAHRNRGIGSALIDAICSLYREEKTEAISLSVDKRSPAKKLYQRLGFEFFKETGSAYTMIKYL